jgi:flagellar hook assembly protein FlgD
MRRILLVFAVLGLPAAIESQATNVSSNITTNTEWMVAGSPYVITATISVSSGVTLTVDPGVVVQFSNGNYLVVNGTMMAVGTSASPISFTSASATPAAGDWSFVSFTAGASASQLSYVTFQYGGGWGWGSMVYVQGSSPTFDHVTIASSLSTGLDMNTAGGAPTIGNSTFSNNGSYGLHLIAANSVWLSNTAFTGNSSYAVGAEPGTHLLDLTNITATGNGVNAVGYRGGTISAAETWLHGMNWVLTGTVTVAAAATLTVDAGTVVKFGNWTYGNYLVVNGTMMAGGTSASPISFTSASATPAAGDWSFVSFTAGASASRLSYVTFQYGGGWGWGSMVYVQGSSPTFDHVTIASSQSIGLDMNTPGGAPTIGNSTFSNNGSYGLHLIAANSVSLSNTAFTGNSGYAVGAEPGTHLLGLTNITATGNGVNAVGYRGGTISAAETWLHGMNWVLTGTVTVAAAATLTVDAGTVVKFGNGTYGNYLVVNGTLMAGGTSASPISFTSASATPAAGDWSFVSFTAGASASQLSYVTFQYGGGWGWDSMVYVQGSSPSFDHVTIASSQSIGLDMNTPGGAPTITYSTIANNGSYGLYSSSGTGGTVDHTTFSGNGRWGIYASNAPLAVRNCAFVANAGGGLYNATPAAPVNANLNYWGAASGPSSPGPGSGQQISSGVTFEPWLMAAPTAPDYFNPPVAVTNRTFNPSLNVYFKLGFTTTLAGNWTVTILNGSGASVRTLVGSGTSGPATWDGKNDGGVVQPNGTYSYQLAGTASTGQAAATVTGGVVIDTTRALTLTGIAVSQAYFSPNGDGVQDTTTLTATTDYDDAAWTINVKNGSSTVVRTSTGTGTNIAFTWDGKDATSTVQPDGPYTFAISVTDGLASVSGSSAPTILDNTPPVATISSPANGQLLSNAYQSGSLNVTITGMASDLNFKSWTLDYGAGSAPATWTTVASGTTLPTPTPLATWATGAVANGNYTLRLRGFDLAGNVGTFTEPLTLGNFQVSQDVLQLNAASGGSVTYTSTVPFPLTETLTIKDLSGQVVRTLVNAARTAGTYNDSWTGTTDAGPLAKDGPYFYFATETDGAHSFTWDLSGQYVNGFFAYNDSLNIQPWDPFNNKPLTFTYNFPRAGRVTIGISPWSPVPDNCNPPQYCPLNLFYQESGPHTFTWAGIDDTGAFRPDLQALGIITSQSAFPNNAVVLYGAKPVVTNLKVTPPVFGPASGGQTVSLDVTSYQNRPVAVTVTFQNQASLSTLRTISLSGQAPGHVAIPWDGRADNGMLVAPGFYTVTATVVDSLGNQVKSQILTNILY